MNWRHNGINICFVISIFSHVDPCFSDDKKSFRKNLEWRYLIFFAFVFAFAFVRLQIDTVFYCFRIGRLPNFLFSTTHQAASVDYHTAIVRWKTFLCVYMLDISVCVYHSMLACIRFLLFSWPSHLRTRILVSFLFINGQIEPLEPICVQNACICSILRIFQGVRIQCSVQCSLFTAIHLKNFAIEAINNRLQNFSCQCVK